LGQEGNVSNCVSEKTPLAQRASSYAERETKNTERKAKKRIERKEMGGRADWPRRWRGKKKTIRSLELWKGITSFIRKEQAAGKEGHIPLKLIRNFEKKIIWSCQPGGRDTQGL